MLFPRGKGSELFDFSLWECGGKVKCGVQALIRTACSESHVPCGVQLPRRELTPVRLCSVRLSWRQRARPSTTLHEIQICRSRLEYIVCTTAGGGPQLVGYGAAEVVSTGCGGVGVLERRCEWKPGSGEDVMKRYLKFASSFWMSAFLVTASMATAQTTSTAKAKKKSGSSTTSTAPAATAPSGGTTVSTTSADAASATQTTVTAQTQQSTTTTTAPKMMIGPDKHMIPVPQQ